MHCMVRRPQPVSKSTEGVAVATSRAEPESTLVEGIASLEVGEHLPSHPVNPARPSYGWHRNAKGELVGCLFKNCTIPLHGDIVHVGPLPKYEGPPGDIEASKEFIYSHLTEGYTRPYILHAFEHDTSITVQGHRARIRRVEAEIKRRKDAATAAEERARAAAERKHTKTGRKCTKSGNASIE